ncbi:MAG: response regulator transcription factor [Lachnospiraceae bacterium]|jgi:two-component system response regulator protein BraR/BceR|nr:response regulator transcription factor [Lachnospiraceae bacterium]
MYKIMLVEDDENMANAMRTQLQAWGYEVYCIQNFQKVTEEFLAVEPQLVLLDIMLPFFNGYHWCSEIRKHSNVPILFISSASDNMNIIMAMNMGGDDFIAKPFDLNVLLAKVQAILRRTYDLTGSIPVLEHKGAILNLNDMTLHYGEQILDLTRNEFRILQTLLEQKGKVVSRNTLMMRLWEIDSYVEENTLTVNINRLRKKLVEIGLEDYIKTKVGCGYIIE